MRSAELDFLQEKIAKVVSAPGGRKPSSDSYCTSLLTIALNQINNSLLLLMPMGNMQSAY